MAQKIVVVIGSVYSRLTILAQAEPLIYRKTGTYRTTYEKQRVICRCECGNTVIVRVDMLRAGHLHSCGCLRDEKAREHMRILGGTPGLSRRNRTHGRTNTPEFYVWRTMLARCSNPKQQSYPRYGGRGITVCERWLHSFENFLLDMGERPSPKHSIDRIDNDGHYEPGNCKWSTTHEQSTNRGSNVFLTYKGETLCAADWAKRIGIDRGSIQRRLQDGWSVEAALTTPPIPRSLRNAKRSKPL